MASIFSYVVVHDSGFAPNPFGGVLTLATCKPQIRKTAQPSDWLVGTGSVRTVGADRIVYAARIADAIFRLRCMEQASNFGKRSQVSRVIRGDWRETISTFWTIAANGANAEILTTARTTWAMTSTDVTFLYARLFGISAATLHLCRQCFVRSLSVTVVTEESRIHSS